MNIDPKLRITLRRIGRDNAHSPERLTAAVLQVREMATNLLIEDNLYDEDTKVEVEILLGVILDAALEAQEQKRGAGVQ